VTRRSPDKDRIERADREARILIDTERIEREKKTARLREQRLALDVSMPQRAEEGAPPEGLAFSSPKSRNLTAT
jgi:hypothetical protein